MPKLLETDKTVEREATLSPEFNQLSNEQFSNTVSLDDSTNRLAEKQVVNWPDNRCPRRRRAEDDILTERKLRFNGLTRVLSGEPDHRDVYLTDEERAASDCFLPCCSRSKSRMLMLDL